MNVITALTGLRSTRSFTDDDVPETQVTSWLDAARWCGSSRNSQPWRPIVVRDPEVRRILSSLGDHASHLATAPVVVVLAAVEGPFPYSTTFDIGRFAQSLMLAAYHDGVSSCVAVFEPESKIARARVLLDVPANVRVDLAIGFGVAEAGRPRETATAPSPRGRWLHSEITSQERFGRPHR